MRLILAIIITIWFSSCSTKYKGLHTDYKKFHIDIEYCLKKSCMHKTKNVFYNLSIISSALAYGGGGGGGGGGGLPKNRISHKVFDLCLQEKGYFKHESGMFELPYLTCD